MVFPIWVNADGTAKWSSILVDCGVMAGMYFFTALAGLGASGLLVDWKLGLLAAGISSGAGFFATLAWRRGIITTPPAPPKPPGGKATA